MGLSTSSLITVPPVLAHPIASAHRRAGAFLFLGERLWLDYVNTDDVSRGTRIDLLRDFDALVQWMEASTLFDTERAAGMRRRAQQQPAGAAAALVDARRVRAALRSLAEEQERARAAMRGRERVRQDRRHRDER